MPNLFHFSISFVKLRLDRGMDGGVPGPVVSDFGVRSTDLPSFRVSHLGVLTAQCLEMFARKRTLARTQTLPLHRRPMERPGGEFLLTT